MTHSTPDFLCRRDPESHKGWYGHALLVAGSYGKMGAAVLAAKACLRSGVGLLTVHVPRCGVEILQTAVPEAMVSIDECDTCFSSLPDNLERFDAIAIGPGLGTDSRTEKALLTLLRSLGHTEEGNLVKPLVVDADGLNIMAGHPEAMRLVASAVFTPHAKEYARLFGSSKPQEMSERYGLYIVCKAHRTMVYGPGCLPVMNDTGNAGMATAGSGDVLTGMILGLLTQNAVYYRHCDNKPAMTLQQVTALAVCLHGMAGDKAASLRSMPSMIASDIIDNIHFPNY